MTTFRFKIAGFLIVMQLAGCATMGKILNPFYETPSPNAFKGQPNDHALNEDAGKDIQARASLDEMATYPRAHAPEPVNPVVQPAVVRLIWIPDHLNSNGDLVPAHYYYLKVLDDRFAVTDVFDKESQLNTGQNPGSIPYVSTK